VKLPGDSFLASYSMNGQRLPPIFEPLADPDSPDAISLFGSVDAPVGVMRVARRMPDLSGDEPVFGECSDGEFDGFPCEGDGNCPGGTCGSTTCRDAVTGTDTGLLCSRDSQKPFLSDAAKTPLEVPLNQMVEAFPWETTARYVIRDRDRIYGTNFRRRVEGLSLHEVPIAPRSPWQDAYAERFIGSLRRECLDHAIVFNERHLGQILSDYRRYYNRSRTHLALEKDAPEPRTAQERHLGEVVAFPEVGGLHHRYERRAA
jgi:hypothetical protein